jgi:hypothetical protein
MAQAMVEAMSSGERSVMCMVLGCKKQEERDIVAVLKEEFHE